MSSFEQIHAAVVEKSEMVSQLEPRMAIFVDLTRPLTFWPNNQLTSSSGHIQHLYEVSLL